MHKLKKVAIIFSFILLFLFISWATLYLKLSNDDVIAKWTNKEMTQKARQAFGKRYSSNGIDVNNCYVVYDRRNKIFDEYYLKYYPELVGREYQAIRFKQKGPLRPGGGSCWIVIDKKSGEILLVDMDM